MITMQPDYPLLPDEFIKHGILAPKSFAPESRVSHIISVQLCNLKEGAS